MTTQLLVVSGNPGLAMMLGMHGYEVDDCRPASDWPASVFRADALVLDLGNVAAAAEAVTQLAGKAVPTMLVGLADSDWAALAEKLGSPLLCLPVTPTAVVSRLEELLAVDRGADVVPRPEPPRDPGAEAAQVQTGPVSATPVVRSTRLPSKPESADVAAPLPNLTVVARTTATPVSVSATALTPPDAGARVLDNPLSAAALRTSSQRDPTVAALPPRLKQLPNPVDAPADAPRTLSATRLDDLDTSSDEATAPAPALRDAVAAVMPTLAAAVEPEASSVDASPPRRSRARHRVEARTPSRAAEIQPGAATDLVALLLSRLSELTSLSDVAAVILADAVDTCRAQAGALLVADGQTWTVQASHALRPLEARVRVAGDSWLIERVIGQGLGLLVQGSDIARQRLAGLPVASWENLAAVPVGGGLGLVLLGAQDHPFSEADLSALVAIDDEATELITRAVELRTLARALSAFADDDG
ncbi:MAG: hypothetical protein NVS3B26_10140 [Mycobacteriales bacterium]